MCQHFIGVGEGITLTVGAITPVASLLPQMVGHGQAEAAVFAEDGRAGVFRRRRAGAGVNMNIMYIADGEIVPAAGAIGEAGGVKRLDGGGDLYGLGLGPAL